MIIEWACLFFFLLENASETMMFWQILSDNEQRNEKKEAQLGHNQIWWLYQNIWRGIFLAFNDLLYDKDFAFKIFVNSDNCIRGIHINQMKLLKIQFYLKIL